MARQVNAAAFAVAQAAEGCVLHAYRDPAGVLTIGYGHTGPDVMPGMVIDLARAEAMRAADMAHAAAFVAAHVRVGLTDNQFSALAEFTYNVGVGNFAGSTLLRRLNQGRYDLVPAELARWTRAGGVVLPGLVARRAREAALFLTPETPPQPVQVADAGSLCTLAPKPAAPSLIERLRGWLHGRAAA